MVEKHQDTERENFLKKISIDVKTAKDADFLIRCEEAVEYFKSIGFKPTCGLSLEECVEIYEKACDDISVVDECSEEVLLDINKMFDEEIKRLDEENEILKKQIKQLKMNPAGSSDQT